MSISIHFKMTAHLLHLAKKKMAQKTLTLDKSSISRLIGERKHLIQCLGDEKQSYKNFLTAFFS